MAGEEKKPSKAKVFLSQHGEKVALGTAVALLLGYFVMAVVLGKENSLATDTRRISDDMKREMNRPHPDNLQPKPPRPWMAQSLDPWNNVGERATLPF